MTMDKDRHYAGIARQMAGQDGQALQHFMSNSPWSGEMVYQRIQEDIQATPQLAEGSYLLLDESADEKADIHSAGWLRQYNGRLGKVDTCQVSVVLGYTHWRSVPWTIWAMVDSALFVPAEWFTPDFAQARQKLGIPKERRFQTKAELGLEMIRRAKAQGLPFEALACDDLYGRDSHFRAELERAGVTYFADVPANTRVYLQPPQIGVPEKTAGPGRPNRRPKVLNGVPSVRVEQVGKRPDTLWQRLFIRHNERGVLEDDFAARRVWIWNQPENELREEWLILRIERNGDHTYLLSNALQETPLDCLAEGACARYFVERVIRTMKIFDFPPQNLVIEITERVLVAELAEARDKLTRLREMGVRIALDDFGTGYTSLQYLQSLPVDTLKIDRCFVDGVARRADLEVIVRSVLSLAAGLGYEVIAEGVERDDDADLLRELGCVNAQGFGLYRPVSSSLMWSLLGCADAAQGADADALRLDGDAVRAPSLSGALLETDGLLA